jgi:hypothetical protein
MYVTVRQYAEITPATFDTLMSQRAEIAALHRDVPGFVQYDLVRTDYGLTSFSVCTDRIGAEVSNLSVAAWIELNLPGLLKQAPLISGGEQVMHLSAYAS